MVWKWARISLDIFVMKTVLWLAFLKRLLPDWLIGINQILIELRNKKTNKLNKRIDRFKLMHWKVAWIKKGFPYKKLIK